MKKIVLRPKSIDSVASLNSQFEIYETQHPLINIIKLEEHDCINHDVDEPLLINLYSIWYKTGITGGLQYGENKVDFDDGALFFMAPGQLLHTQKNNHTGGWGVYFHPDLLNGTTLSKKIKSYNFFAYATNKAMYLSKEEEVELQHILSNIKREMQQFADHFSSDVIISYLDTLLIYGDRYYHRQTNNYKEIKFGLLEKVEEVLYKSVNGGNLQIDGIPTVQYLAEQLNMTANHLNEQLKTNSGITANEYISRAITEKAKELITTTTFSAGEIAFLLGYQHSQSFSKLFKKNVGCSPIEYRKRFQKQ